ncbi:MAG: hypothetical protein ACRDRH_23550 [Pseudonocardia sp.]
MNRVGRWLAVAVLAFLPLGAAAPVAVAMAPAAPAVSTAAARDCNARNNLDEVAAKFISRCRKGSINREFPDSHRPRTLGQIMSGQTADDKKAWKLLNDGRFAK